MYLLAPFTVQNFKKIRRGNLKLGGCAVFRLKMVCLPHKRILSENPLVNLVAFIHVCLHAQNQSQISIHIEMRYEILTIKEY